MLNAYSLKRPEGMKVLRFLIFLWLPVGLFAQNQPPVLFELDGDLYNDAATTEETIDWFSHDISRMGVIDVSSADSIYNILKTASNARQRNLEFHFYGSQQNAPWILDALYQRDQISATSARDASTFITGASKNADHPQSWNIGVPGAPQKGDLVDVFSLLMRNGQAISGDLWFIGGASTLTASGNKHIDFEFYREELHLNNNQILSAGKSGGRTAWLFDENGKVLQTGDFIVSVDYLNGGTQLKSSIRVWVDPQTFPNGNLTALNGLLPFYLNGIFDQGTQSGSFGYAEVELPAGSSALFVKANDVFQTTAAPWGTLNGSKAELATDYIPMQGLEVAVNMSALGLDPSRYEGLACDAPLGTVLVKSRASQSFTAELKDLVRPMPFGNNSEWELNVSSNDLNCIRQQVVPDLTPQSSFLAYQWEGPQRFSSDQMLPEFSLPGTYFLTVGPPQGCVMKDTLIVGIDTVKPDLQLTGGIINCIHTSVELRASSSVAGAAFTWEGPDGSTFTGSNWSVSKGGWYSATATHPRSGCTITEKIEVNVDTLTPDVQLEALHLNCLQPSDRLTLSVSPQGNYQYQWTGPHGFSSRELSPLISETGTYKLFVSVPGNGCQTEAYLEVTADFEAPVLQFENDTLTCLDTLIQLNGHIQPTNNIIIAWTGPNGFSSTDKYPWISEAGTYQIKVTNNENACSTTQTVKVDSIDVFEDMAPTGGELTCQQDEVQLRSGLAEAGYSFNWSGPNGFSSTSAEPFVKESGIYDLTITHVATGCESTDSVKVTSSRSVPQLSVQDSVMLNCSRSNWRPTFPSDYQYQWSSTGGFSSSSNSPTIHEGGTYTLVVTDPASGCDTTLTVVVEEDFTRPVVNLSGSPLTCLEPTTELAFEVSSAENYTFYWLGPYGFFSREENPEISIAGNYRLYVRNTENGCLTIASLNIEDQNKPISVTAVGGTLNCKTDSVQLAFIADPGDYEILWTGPGGFTSTDLSPWVKTGGSYTIQLTDTVSGCTGSSMIRVNEDYSPPSFRLIKNSDLNCQYQQVRLTAYPTNNYTFSWWMNGDSIGSSYYIYVSETGTYTVKVTNPANGCEAEKTITVEEHLDVPTATITAPDSLSCANRTVQLQLGDLGDGNYSYFWSGPNGFTSNQMEPWVTKAGTYYLKLTHSLSRCDTLLTFTVTGDPTPLSVQAIGGTLTCNDPDAQLQVVYDGNGPLTYSWTGPEGFTSSEAEPVVTVAGSYRLQVSDPLTGCTDIAYANVQDDTEISYLRVGSGTLGCEGSSTRLTAQYSLGNYAFSWTGPEGFVSSDRSPIISEAGTYVLTLTDQRTGCTATDSVWVSRTETPPAISLQSNGVLTCIQNSVKLYAITSGGSYSYAWRGPLGFSSDESIPTVSEAGIYYLSITDQTSHCQAVDSIVVTANQHAPVISIADTALNCESTHITLGDQLPADYNYSWSGPNGFTATGTPITVSTAGSYYLSVLDPLNGCETSEIIAVDEAPPCTDAICTQTQGFYGSDNGRFCDGRTTRELLLDLLQTDLIIGGGDNRFTLSADELDAFFMRMPGGGMSIPLDGVATSVNPVGIPLDNNGQFDNNLLAQTITLGLNLRLSPGLAKVVLENTELVTLASSDCQDTEAEAVKGSERSFHIPSSIIDYLTHPTIGVLYALANEALAGTYVPQAGMPGYGEITGALGAINDGFNECRMVKEFTIAAMPEIGWSVSSYPNPTSGEPVSFGFQALENGAATLNLHNMITGALVSLPYEGNLIAGESYAISIPVDQLSEGTYFYLLRVNGEIVAQGSIRVFQ